MISNKQKEIPAIMTPTNKKKHKAIKPDTNPISIIFIPQNY